MVSNLKVIAYNQQMFAELYWVYWLAFPQVKAEHRFLTCPESDQ